MPIAPRKGEPVKGLDQFLAKIKSTPRPTLVSRYLALIADLPTEDEKTTRALDLAEALLQAKPAETLRIAHMVFTTDRFNLRALDLMIDAMHARGRAGKAEVLRLEKAKIEKEMSDTPVREPTGRLPQALFEPQSPADKVSLPKDFRDLPDPEFSRIAEIDLNTGPADDGELDALARLFPSDAPVQRSETILSHVELRLDAIQAIPDHKPSDTVLPFNQGGVHSDQSMAERTASPLQEMFAPTLNLGIDMDGSATPASTPAVPYHFLDAPKVHPGAEQFDQLWQSGYVNEARHVLKLAEAQASELWWQTRQAIAERALKVAPDVARSPKHDVILVVPQDNSLDASANDHEFWTSMQSELDRLSAQSPHQFVPEKSLRKVQELLASLRQPSGCELPRDFAQHIAELDHRSPGRGEALFFKWKVIQGLWPGRADGRLAALLEEMALTDANVGFFGLYLDALLASDQTRRGMVVVRRVLLAKPHLAWAKAAWERLPQMFAALQVHSITWSEDDGVPTLIAQLNKRPKPKLAAVAPACPRPRVAR